MSFQAREYVGNQFSQAYFRLINNYAQSDRTIHGDITRLTTSKFPWKDYPEARYYFYLSVINCKHVRDNIKARQHKSWNKYRVDDQKQIKLALNYLATGDYNSQAALGFYQCRGLHIEKNFKEGLSNILKTDLSESARIIGQMPVDDFSLEAIQLLSLPKSQWSACSQFATLLQLALQPQNSASLLLAQKRYLTSLGLVPAVRQVKVSVAEGAQEEKEEHRPGTLSAFFGGLSQLVWAQAVSSDNTTPVKQVGNLDAAHVQYIERIKCLFSSIVLKKEKQGSLKQADLVLLGMAYLFDLHQGAPDAEKGVQYLQDEKLQHSMTAHYYLYHAYRYGLGVNIDLDQASIHLDTFYTLSKKQPRGDISSLLYQEELVRFFQEGYPMSHGQACFLIGRDADAVQIGLTALNNRVDMDDVNQSTKARLALANSARQDKLLNTEKQSGVSVAKAHYLAVIENLSAAQPDKEAAFKQLSTLPGIDKETLDSCRLSVEWHDDGDVYKEAKQQNSKATNEVKALFQRIQNWDANDFQGITKSSTQAARKTLKAYKKQGMVDDTLDYALAMLDRTISVFEKMAFDDQTLLKLAKSEQKPWAMVCLAERYLARKNFYSSKPEVMGPFELLHRARCVSEGTEASLVTENIFPVLMKKAFDAYSSEHTQNAFAGRRRKQFADFMQAFVNQENTQIQIYKGKQALENKLTGMWNGYVSDLPQKDRDQFLALLKTNDLCSGLRLLNAAPKKVQPGNSSSTGAVLQKTSNRPPPANPQMMAQPSAPPPYVANAQSACPVLLDSNPAAMRPSQNPYAFQGEVRPFHRRVDERVVEQNKVRPVEEAPPSVQIDIAPVSPSSALFKGVTVVPKASVSRPEEKQDDKRPAEVKSKKKSKKKRRDCDSESRVVIMT